MLPNIFCKKSYISYMYCYKVDFFRVNSIKSTQVSNIYIFYKRIQLGFNVAVFSNDSCAAVEF